MMLDINVLFCFVLDRIISHVDCIGVVTHERNDVDVDSKILKLLLYPKNLGTVGNNKYILNLSH